MVLPLRWRQLRERAASFEASRQLQSSGGLVPWQTFDTEPIGDREAGTQTIQAIGENNRQLFRCLSFFFFQVSRHLFIFFLTLRLYSFSISVAVYGKIDVDFIKFWHSTFFLSFLRNFSKSCIKLSLPFLHFTQRKPVENFSPKNAKKSRGRSFQNVVFKTRLLFNFFAPNKSTISVSSNVHTERQ